MNHSCSLMIIIALILFSIYRRIRRNIGWQLLEQKKLVFRISLFFIIGVLFLAEGFFHPISLISDLIGIVIGGCLAYFSVALTRFENREGWIYYLPNIWVGSIVTVIFLIRFIYRFYGLFTNGDLAGINSGQTNGFQSIGYASGSSWTNGLMLIMFAYYTIYYLILIRKQHQFIQSGNHLTDQ